MAINGKRKTPIIAAQSEKKDGPGAEPSPAGKSGGKARASRTATKKSLGVKSAVLERIGDGILALDAGLNYEYLNERAGELLGCNPVDLIGKSLWQAHPGAERTPFVEACRRALETQSVVMLDGYFPASGRWLEGRVYPSTDGVSVLLSEGTPHDQEENRRREERYRILFDTMQEGFLLAEVLQGNEGAMDARLLEVNASMARFLHHDRDQLVGHTIRSVYRLERPHLELLERACRVAQGLEDPFSIEQYDPAAGRWLRGNIFSPRPGQFAGLLSDVSEQKRVETMLQDVSKFPAENPNPVLRFTPAGEMLYANQASLSLLGAWEQHEPHTTPLAEIRRLLPAVLESGSNREIEVVNDKTLYMGLLVPVLDQGYINLYLRDITQRKQAEEALRAHIHQTNAGITRTDLEGRFTFVNEAFCQMVGYPEAELIGRTIWEISHPDDIARNRTMLQRLVQEGESFQLEKRILRRNGSFVWISVGSSPLRDASGRIYAATTIIVDITRRKRAEESLLESARHSLYLSSLSDAIHSLSDPSKIQIEAARLLGASLKASRVAYVEIEPDGTAIVRENYVDNVSDIIGQFPIDTCIPADQMSRFRAGRTVTVSDVRSDPRFDEAQRSAHEALAVRAQVVVPFLRSGELIAALCIQQDQPRSWQNKEISLVEETAERLQAEIERAHAERRLRESERRFQQAASAAGALVYEVDVLSGAAEIVHGMQSLTGYDPQETPMSSGWWHSLIHPDDLPAYLAQLQHLLETGGTDVCEYRLRHRKGAWIHIQDNRMVVQGERGRRRRLIGTVIDSSERKRSENVLRRRARQQQAVAKLGELTLRERDLQKIFDHATDMVARTLEVEYCKVLELLERGELLLLRSGVGWQEGLVGQATVDTGFDSQAGYTLRTDEPVIVEDLASESRFHGPSLLIDHGVISGMSCVIRRFDGHSWGVLGTHSTRSILFTEDDVNFLVAVANILGDAIQREQTEQERRNAEERYTTLFAAVQEGFAHYQAVYDEQGLLTDIRVVEINPAGARITGVPRQEQVGKTWRQIWPRINEETIGVYRRADETRQSLRFEDVNRQTGSTYEVVISTVSPGEFIATFSDITERKRAEQELAEFARQQEALYQLAERLNRTESLQDVFDPALDAILAALQCDRASILLHDEAGVMRFAAWRGLSETYRRATDGHSPWKRDAVDPRPIAMDDIETAELEESLRSTVRAEGIGALAFIPLVSNEKLIGKFMVYFDRPHAFEPAELEFGLTIARQLASTIERKRAEEAVRASEALYRAIARSIPGGGVYVVDRDFRYRVAEGPVTEAFGLTREMLEGHTVMEAFPDERGRRMEERLRRNFAGETVRFETPFNGRVYWTQQAPLLDSKGQVIILTLDITERKRAEEAMAADLANMRILSDLGARLVTEADLHVIYQAFVLAAVAITHADAGTVQLLDESTGELVLLAAHGLDPDMVEHFQRVKAGSRTSCGIALARKERAFVDFDDPDAEDPDGALRRHLDAGLRSAQSTPLISRSGKPIGMISTHWSKHHRPGDQELRYIDLLARQASDLIERKQAEQALRESEERFREIFETAGVSVWVEDFSEVKAAIDELRRQGVGEIRSYLSDHPDFVRRAIELVRVVEVNNETLDLFKAPSKADMLRSLAQIFTPETEPVFVQELVALAEGHEMIRTEAQVQTLDGQPLSVILSVHFNPHANDYSRVVVTLTDITSRKQMEEELQQSEERFARFMQHLPGLAWIKDLDGRYIYANAMAEKVFRTSGGHLYGRTDRDLFPPEIAAQFRKNDELALMNEKGVQVVETLKHEDGLLHSSLVSKFPIPGPDGKPALIGGTALDITDRIQMEQALQAARERAEETANRISRLQEVTASLAGWETITPAQLAELTLEQGTRAAGASAGLLAELFEDGQQIKVLAALGYPPGTIGREAMPLSFPSPLTDCIRTRQAIWLRSQEEYEARYPALAEMQRRLGHEAAVTLPLMVGERVLGSLAFGFVERRTFNSEEQEFFLAVARQASQGMERAHAEEQLLAAREQAEQTASRMERLQKVTASLSDVLTPLQVTHVIVDQGVPSLGAVTGSVFLLTEDGQNLELVYSNARKELIQPYQSFAISLDLPSAQAVRAGQPVWLESRQQYLERYPHLAEEIERWGREAALAIPMIHKGRTLGVLALSFDHVLPHSEEDQEYILTLARQGAQALGRARAEEALRDSEERYRAIISQATAGIVRKDASGRLLFVNQAFCNMLDMLDSDLIGRTMWELTHEDDREENKRLYHRLMKEGTPFQLEKRLIRRDGSPLWVNVSVSPVIGKSGRPQSAVSVYADISRRKQAESRLMLLARISELTRQVEEPDELLYAVAREVGEFFQVRRALFNEIDVDNDRAVVHRDYCREGESVAGVHTISGYSSSTALEMMAGRTVVNNDSKTDPRTAQDYERSYMPNGERAYVAVPLLHEDRWVASLWVSDDRPHQWDRDDVYLLEAIAERTWTAAEKMRVDRALRDSEERLRVTFNTTAVGFALLTPDTRFVDVNDALCHIVGYTREELLSMTLDTLVHPDFIKSTRDHISRLLAGQVSSFTIEKLYIRGDGAEIWVQNSISLVRDPDENPLHLIAICQDITERKREEEALRARTEEIETLMNVSPIGIFVANDPECRFISANPAGYRLLEVPGSSKTNISRSAPPMEQPSYRVFREGIEVAAENMPMQAAARHGIELKEEALELRFENGARKYVYAFAKPLFDAKGRSRGAIAAMLDITERKRAEEELHQMNLQLEERVLNRTAELQAAYEFLRESEATSRLILESMPDAIVITDRDGRIVHANTQIETLFGYTPNEVLGKPVEMLLPERLRSQHTKNRDLYSDQRTRHVMGLGLDLFGKRKDESEFPVDIMLSPINNNTSWDVMVSIRDNTKQRQAQEALRINEEKLRTLFEILPVGISFMGKEGRIVDMNPALTQILGMSKNELLRGAFKARRYIRSDGMPMAPQEFASQRAIAEQKTIYNVETGIVLENGEIKWTSVNAAPVQVADVEVVVVTIDITDRKQSEEAINRHRESLKLLSRRLVEVQEEERLAIARELHDRVGQNLAALTLNLNILRSQLTKEILDKVGVRLNDSLNLVKDVLAITRSVMADLRPNVLDDYGLDAALTEYADRFSQRFGIRVVNHMPATPTPRLDPGIEMTLLRIAQEALTNIARHAQASQASMTLAVGHDAADLIVEDNGIGILSWQKVNQPGSHGIRIMRERAEAFGGTLKVHSAYKNGTKIEVNIPLGAGTARNKTSQEKRS